MKAGLNMENKIKIGGRHIYKDGILYLSFSGSFIEFEFEGTYLSVEIKTDKAEDEQLMGYAGLFINDKFKEKIKLDKPQSAYEIYKSDKPGKVKIRLMRFSENNFGKMGIVSLAGNGRITPTPEKDLKIEFIGNSITCGYGVEASNENETFRTETENPAKAFAVLTAEALDADFALVSWSGNGLLTQWIPPERDVPDITVPLMPDMYRMADYGGYAFEGYDAPGDYDFSAFTPDIVVINLGTNDASYTRKIPERVGAFGKAYGEFLSFVREKRPDAKIICCLGVMNTDLCDEVNRQVEIKRETDPDIYFIRQDIMRKDEPYGADWHPGEKAQKRIAAQLIDFIKTII